MRLDGVLIGLIPRSNDGASDCWVFITMMNLEESGLTLIGANSPKLLLLIRLMTQLQNDLFGVSRGTLEPCC